MSAPIAGQQSPFPNTLIDSTFVAASTIPCGSPVEVVNGKVQVCSSAGSSVNLYGIAVSNGSGSYAAGQPVSVMVQGFIFGVWSGSTAAGAYHVAPNIAHSSTTGTKGSFTDAATSTTVGSEVSAAPGTVLTLANVSSLYAGLAYFYLELVGP